MYRRDFKKYKMKAMIFAAGLGTRLKPITDTLPKALVPVGGKPLLEHVSRKLKAAGIEESVVNVHHFADMIQDWVCSDAENENGTGMHMQVSDERDLLLETGGGILKARKYLDGCGNFIVHNVDILSDLDINWFASQVKQDAIATLLVSERQTSRYLLFDSESLRLVGWTNVKTGEVRTPFSGLDPDACLKLAFSGIHIISDKVFDIMESYVNEKGLHDKSCNPRFPIIDFYLSACASHPIYGVLSSDLQLIDVGKLDSLEQAEMLAQKL